MSFELQQKLINADTQQEACLKTCHCGNNVFYCCEDSNKLICACCYLDSDAPPPEPENPIEE